MSDFSIPGVSSKYNTSKMIEDLMKLERVPLTRAEERIDTFKLQKKNWQELSRDLARVDDSAKHLFSYQNPFMERLASSSDDSILTASATREAVEENRSILVKQVATADRFLSDSLDRDFRVEDGTYTISIGDREVSFSYSGGSLSDFAATLERRSNGLLRTSVVKNTPTTQVLLIEGTKTGSGNQLTFSDKARDFALKAGILEEQTTSTRTITPSASTVQQPDERSRIAAGSLIIDPDTKREISFTPPVNLKPGEIVEFTIEIEKLSEKEYVPPAAPPGPAQADSGAVTLEDVTVSNIQGSPVLPEWSAPPPPEKRLDMNILSVKGASDSRNLAPLNDTTGIQTIQLSADQIPANAEALIIDNVNTHRRISVSAIRIYDPNTRGDTHPKNAVNTAGNAVIEVDGIEVIRENNDIDDIIQGVTLNLKRPGSREIDLSITPDRETVKDAIIGFVGYYNQLISQINIYTSTDEAVVNELDYLSDDERDKALEQLGLFQGEMSLTQIKSRMQRIMMDPYTTRDGSELSILAQIGISTNSSGGGGGLRTSRLRGYLEIDENKLDKALETRLDAIKDLFGYDSDGDLVVDQGVGYAVDNYIKPYVQTGGIIAYKTTAIDGQIDRTNREIDNLERNLERKEQQLRRQYGMMEGALQQMEDNSKALENFSNRNSD